MRTRVQRWGNNLVVRIPKSFAAELHLDHDSEVDLTLVDGKIVVVPVPISALTLGELLEGVTEQNVHHEIDTANAVGQEAW